MGDIPEELNVEELTEEEYGEFVATMRRALGVEEVYGRPLLPPQEDQNPTHFTIVLRTNTRSITVAFRRGNLYVDGYRMENGTQWIEFGNRNDTPPPPHLLDKSDFIGFGGDYTALRTAANRSQDEIRLGQQTLVTAINTLARTTSRQERARNLIVLIIMLSEAIRLTRISDLIVANYYGGIFVPGWLEDYVHGWQDTSAAVLRQQANPQQPFPLPQPNNLGITTLQEALAALGIILRYKHIQRRLRRAVSEFVAQGRALVEVFSIRIKNYDGADSSISLYGSITMTDGLWCHTLYDRKERNPETISEGDTILLSGPGRAISGYGSFTVDLSLLNKDGDHSSSDIVSAGMLSWNYYDVRNEYDKLLTHRIDGQYGSVTLSYVVFSDAVEAQVEVTLVKGAQSGGGASNVNGIITARSEKFEVESMLFWATTDDTLPVNRGGVVKLLRCAVPVPTNSSLVIQANLLDYKIDSSSNAEIAKGNLRFPVKPTGTSDGRIHGREGEIMVRIKWVN